MSRIVLAFLCSMFWVVPASAVSLEELTPYFTGHYFTWEEHRNNRELLKETGPLFAAGLVVAATTDSSFTLRGKSELFGGVVDYDGETQDSAPVQTEVNYFGLMYQADLGHAIPIGALRLEPFIGLGHRLWLRNLESSRDVTGRAVSGYTEYWQTGYGRFGARGRYLTGAGVSLFAEGGGKRPFYTGNTTYLLGPRSTVHPRGRWSGFAEVGAHWRELRLALQYERFRWEESPVTRVGSGGLFQPQSSSDIFGLSVGWNFR